MKTDVTDGILQATFEIGRMLRKKSLASKAAIHMGQLHALAFIREQDGITMKELAAMMQITSPSATSFVDRLVQLKYVRRSQHQRNRKMVHLSVTPLGKRVLKEQMAEKKKMFARILTSLSSSDQMTLLVILRKMLAGSAS
jgi:DNA-binding MarR family transcriptional regulator